MPVRAALDPALLLATCMVQNRKSSKLRCSQCHLITHKGPLHLHYLPLAFCCPYCYICRPPCSDYMPHLSHSTNTPSDPLKPHPATLPAGAQPAREPSRPHTRNATVQGTPASSFQPPRHRDAYSSVPSASSLAAIECVLLASWGGKLSPIVE